MALDEHVLRATDRKREHEFVVKSTDIDDVVEVVEYLR